MTNRALDLLGLLYLPEAIYLREVSTYSVERKTVTGQFTVPRSHSYTRHPIEYVTAEQHVRCLSQLSYVLIGFLIEDEITDFADYETFTRLMVECKMWFRRSEIRYLKNISKGTCFEVSLGLNRIKAIRSFTSCTLEVSGVLRGELEFVAPLASQE